MTLLAYRLRPLSPALLAGVPLALLIGAWWIAPHLEPSDALKILQATAVPLGLLTAFTVSADVDPPEPVLATSPHPYWRTPALRVSLLFIFSSVAIGLIAWVIDMRLSQRFPTGAAISMSRADLALITALAFVLSIRWGSFMGGAGTLATLILFASAQRLWRYWPLRVLDTVGTPHWETTRGQLLVAAVLCALFGALYLRSRGSTLRRALAHF